eukprot:CAMPEP_0171098254 /NCGR_PEP_ID=MMETSP0766_2-20121228/48021_1 /TAXON_ID=439317 /ORGANISM="Gambierdiscus australes, Strain CAWD 149" /LENGTH=126 /DNA_ID=CAMNT_0011557579 /DNA_START=214 /DNA_END=595 /DNA_ORIENTATION=+
MSSHGRGEFLTMCAKRPRLNGSKLLSLLQGLQLHLVQLFGKHEAASSETSRGVGGGTSRSRAGSNASSTLQTDACEDWRLCSSGGSSQPSSVLCRLKPSERLSHVVKSDSTSEMSLCPSSSSAQAV